MDSIAKNLESAHAAIAAAAVAAGRNPETIELIAVSKRKPVTAITAASRAGQQHFGENFLQEAIPKIETLADLDLTWHFIGAIQSNKTRLIARHFDWVHTVDREKIGLRLDAQCPEHKRLNVCLQVNIDADPNKAGVLAGDAGTLLQALVGLPHLSVRGLMTILDPASEPGESYARLAELFADLAQFAVNGEWDTLSMGMSGDFREAIAAGATQVRIGTAIFGARG